MKTLLLLATLIVSTSAWAAQNFNLSASSSNVEISDVTPASARTVDRYGYNFGLVVIGTTKYVTYTLTNTGTTPLTFERAIINGARFDAYHSCDISLQPNQKCRFEISFNPLFVGVQSGQFVLSFIENLDIVVDLWGNGSRY